jgi:hypothetical protein
MPQFTRPSQVTIVQNERGEGKLVITLELNINLNANGMQATIAAVNSAKAAAVEEDEEVGFEIPDFGSSEQIKFGKKVGD